MQRPRCRSSRAEKVRNNACAILRASVFDVSKRSQASSSNGRKRRLPRPKPAAKSRETRSSPTQRPKLKLSADRKRELVGVVLVAFGVVILVSALTSGRGFLGSTWLKLLAYTVGWGAFVIPIGLIGAGALLVAPGLKRRLPGVDLEGILGAGVLYLVTLATFHAVLGASAFDEGMILARAGRGGGLIGAALLALLVSGLGGAGAVVALLALLLIGVSLTSGLPASELLRGAGQVWQRVQARVPGVRSNRRKARPIPSSPTRSTLPVSATDRTAPASRQAFTPAALAPRLAREGWSLPGIEDILEPGSESKADEELDRKRATLIEETLRLFGAPARIVAINRGPTITQFGVEPEFMETRGGRKTRVKVSKVAALADDLALALASRSIRIEAPVPGKGYIGIEVPNAELSVVALRDVMTSPTFEQLNSKLRLGLGRDVSGKAIAADLGSMPHLLIAGTTGSGKSVCVNALISGLLLQNTPHDLRFLMIDPKRVELTGFNGIPHLLAPVVVDLQRVVPALQWISREMDDRYRRFAREGVRNIADYNARRLAIQQEPLPYIAVVIDELADLMMMAPDETERVVTRLAQLARATGIHLIIATQRPSVDVVTGLIKANFPARIAFAVASSVDSRVIIDQPGAERLLGRGDMLFQAADASAPMRMQGAYVSDAELSRLIGFWKQAASLSAPVEGVRNLPASAPLKQAPLWEEETQPALDHDELFEEAVAVLREMRRGSVSVLQRRLRIGYTRAARLIDQLEEAGIVGPADRGSGAREVLDYGTSPGAV
ncbi:MAG: DNA translocase FtsK [Anaerolineales bacterium]